MKELRITEESFKRALAHGRYSDSSCVRWHEMFCVLKSIFVQVESEGWVRKPGTPEYWEKGSYCLKALSNKYELWYYDKEVADLIATLGSSCYPTKSAQAWADALIEEREALAQEELMARCSWCAFKLPPQGVLQYEGKYFCNNHCRRRWIEKHGVEETACQCVTAMGTHSPIGPHHPKCPMYVPPKFGVGSRLVAPNGDEVRIVTAKFPGGHSALCAINLTENEVVLSNENSVFTDNLESALTAAGYRVKDDA